MSTSPYDHATLRQHLLLFDKLYIVGLDRRIAKPDAFPEYQCSPQATDDQFLLERGVIAPTDIRTNEIKAFVSGAHETLEESLHVVRDHSLDPATKIGFLAVEGKLLFDRLVRESAHAIASKTGVETIPLCTYDLPNATSSSPPETLRDVAKVVMSSIPVPADDVAFADILHFRDEMADKRWNLRRFMHSLAGKRHSEAEIRDDIEWTLNEYTKAMANHQIKATHSFIETYLITPLEILEDIVKFNWSKIAKGALQVSKRKVELLEAEMKAPGRECAYVFDARKRFGSGHA